MSAPDEARHGLILRWLADAGRDHVVLACAEAEVPGSLVLPCCLAAAPVAWVAELAAHASVHAAVESCASPDAARNHLAELASLTSRVLLDGGPGPGPTVSYLSPPTRRRGLLGLGGPSAAAPVGTHAERLAAALARLPVRQDASSHASRLTVSDACSACGVCVHSCPEDSLVLELTDGTATLSQRLGACQSERVCVALCPEGAITADGRFSWSEVAGHPTVALAEVAVVACRSCRASFPAADCEPLCRVCRVNERAPFGVHLTPAAQALLDRRRAHRG